MSRHPFGNAVARQEQRLEDRAAEEAARRQASVVAGLRGLPPRISPLWFYDAHGSRLFEHICDLPEYYLTRTEIDILREHRVEMADALGRRVALLEPGSGASVKTRLLLDVLRDPAAYMPVDIAHEALQSAARALRRDYPALRVQPVCADFTATFAVPSQGLGGADRTVVYFPGSTLGNFDRNEAVRLLRQFAQLAGPGGAVLLGLDRVKPVEILERAYDDEAGVTAAFNLNALRHLNREVDATFDLTDFQHRAIWDDVHERIEMHLVARRYTTFEVGDVEFELARGDYLLTEYSHKYTTDSAARIVAEAGLEVRQVWSDAGEWFSVLLLEPVEAGAR